MKLPAGTYELVVPAIAAGAALILFAADVLTGDSLAQLYLLWNLFLAGLPLLLTSWLRWTLTRKAWSSWEGLMVSAVWLAFLPNSFYMVSDFIHLADVNTDRLLFNAVMFTAFVYAALLFGFASLYRVHNELLRRLHRRTAWFIVCAILAACCVAIYIGRDLRWNSWDVLIDPAGLLFDLSARLLHPSQYLQVLTVVLPFFILLTAMYAGIWFGARIVRRHA